MKNKMEIREDPKFLMTNHQGVLTLNIRRPSPFDAGTYSCRAVNELGEDLAECKLEVRGEHPARRALIRAVTRPALGRAETRAESALGPRAVTGEPDSDPNKDDAGQKCWTEGRTGYCAQYCSGHTKLLAVRQTGHAFSSFREFAHAVPSTYNALPCLFSFGLQPMKHLPGKAPWRGCYLSPSDAAAVNTGSQGPSPAVTPSGPGDSPADRSGCRPLTRAQ